MRRFLVVTNQTSGGAALFARIRECLTEGPCRFSVVVPATAVSEQLMSGPGDAAIIAQRRLLGTLARFRAEGAVPSGEVGPADALEAVLSVLARGDVFDEIIVSTLPPGISRWIHQDLVHRLARATGLPVTHVVPTRRERRVAV